MRTAIAFAFVMALVGCTRGNTGQVSASLTASQPMSPTEIHPAARTAQLLVTVVAVRVHVIPPEADEENQAANANANAKAKTDHEDSEATDDDGHWYTVFSGSHQLDLLDIAADQSFLGSVTVPAGRVTQIRLILASTITLVLDGQSLAVSCPSCSESGLKIVADDDIRVTAGGHLMLTLDVDVRASLTLGTGELSIAPVIKLSGAEDDAR
jgi:hypothetical protein